MRFRAKDVKEWPAFWLVAVLMLSLLGVALTGYLFSGLASDLLRAADQGTPTDFWSVPLLMVGTLGIAPFFNYPSFA